MERVAQLDARPLEVAPIASIHSAPAHSSLLAAIPPIAPALTRQARPRKCIREMELIWEITSAWCMTECVIARPGPVQKKEG